MDPWHIIGCGYVGTRLARRLVADGRTVVATRRSEAGCEALRQIVPGATFRCFDLAESSAVDVGAMTGVVVITSPPGSHSPISEGQFAAELPEATRLVYVSTTGVYAPGHGKEVVDSHPLGPGSARGQARLDVEASIRSAHKNSLYLRVPGIYGPHRGVHQRLRAGTYRLIGAADTLVGRIHVDDLVSAIMVLGELSAFSRNEFILGDDCPTTGREHALGVAEAMQLPLPPTVDPASVSPEIRAMLSADRRIVARGLHELGWRPAYASWREGLQQALAEEKSEPKKSD